jgi:[ribosomal protein S18]-alanine N-acetyltransferase
MMALERLAATAAHWSREQYERLLKAGNRDVLVLEESSVVQGFLVARQVDAEWEIENVAIAAPAQQRGLGTQLVGEFLNHARSRGARSVYLEVRESNHAARRLYKKWAFVESGRRERYYREPEEDAVLFRLDFA